MIRESHDTMEGMLRSALTCAIFFIPMLLAAQDNEHRHPPASLPKIVFVCEHGSSKSVVAAAHCRRLAKERGLDIQVVSRGTAPEAEVPTGVRNGLKADGIEVGRFKPAGVSAADLKDATKVISFGPDLSAFTKGSVEDWSATPAVSDDYNAARSYIVKRLQVLLDQLSMPTR
jgi:arsenate reductase